MQDANHDQVNYSWYRWSCFHSQLNLCPGVQPCLRLNSLEPSSSVVALWKGEPIETIILPTQIFSWQAEVREIHRL